MIINETFIVLILQDVRAACGQLSSPCDSGELLGPIRSGSIRLICLATYTSVCSKTRSTVFNNYSYLNNYS